MTDNITSMERIENTTTHSRNKRNAIFKGFVISILTGLISFFSISLARDNMFLNFATQIVLSFVLTYMLTRDWLTTFTLITITDVFLSFTSLFFISIGLPMARGIMLMITMSLFIMSVYQKSFHETNERSWKYSSMSVLIFFYGLVLPLLLVLYSVFIAGTSVGMAFGDVQFMFPLLLYYPISRLLKRRPEIFLGWILAISVTHVIISLILSIGPLEISSKMYQNYSNNILDNATVEGYEGLVTIRNASPAFITSLFGFFAGFLITIDSTNKTLLRFFGLAFSLFCLSHLVLDYMRGPLIATAIILLLFGFAATLKQHYHSFAFHTFLFAFAVMLISGYTMYLIVPEGLLRFIIDTGGYQEYIGTDRTEQAARMIDAFKEEPVLGHGVGSVLRGGYARSSDLLNFELQYHMLLYRVGIVGFIILMFPLAWLIAELFRKKGAMSKRLFQIEGKFHISLLLSMLATCIAGYANPYLKTGYMTLTIAMYLSYRRALQHQLIIA